MHIDTEYRTFTHLRAVLAALFTFTGLTTDFDDVFGTTYRTQPGGPVQPSDVARMTDYEVFGVCEDLATHSKIQLIKAWRSVTGQGLKESKDAIDYIREYADPDQFVPTDSVRLEIQSIRRTDHGFEVTIGNAEAAVTVFRRTAPRMDAVVTVTFE